MENPHPELVGVTAEQVAAIFNIVEAQGADSRSSQGQRRLLKIGGLVTACTAIATAATVALASFGFKVIGPPADIAAVERHVMHVDTKVDSVNEKVEAIITDRAVYRSQTNDRFNALQADVKITKYLACVLVRKSDPNLVPSDCNR